LSGFRPELGHVRPESGHPAILADLTSASPISIDRTLISQGVWVRVQRRRARRVHRHAANDVAMVVDVSQGVWVRVQQRRARRVHRHVASDVAEVSASLRN
jgi:hypothetical protein